ncbi:MAG: N-acetylmuramoyl-L-alanine amidase [Hyphomonadaceae bacterium]|nr:N-acetylmuramoyl-L-alanine amidase [Hyphomonadaceae bacterium]
MKLIDRLSPNFEAREGAIDLVVLHYTGMQDADAALNRLTDPAPVAGRYPGPWQPKDVPADAPLGRVSAHYVVDEGGQIYRLVSEEHRAWHAGRSHWQGRTDTNDRSIGIEIVNGGHDFGLPEFPQAQIDAVIALVRDVLARRSLAPSRVVGHSDVAPGRKLDPGEKFPWYRLAKAGVSIWPAEGGGAKVARPHDVASIQSQLQAFGYGLALTAKLDDPTRFALISFQRRFRPGRIDGKPDEETLALLAALVER